MVAEIYQVASPSSDLPCVIRKKTIAREIRWKGVKQVFEQIAAHLFKPTFLAKRSLMLEDMTWWVSLQVVRH